MKKESSHRSHELKALGWSQDDLTRYEEIWEYSQRWGLINLEREDRQFLKKAEKLLPKLQLKKFSTKKSIEEKSYYLWLAFYLENIKSFNKSKIIGNLVSVWELLIEEELKLLQKCNPVMGLPDTLKAKNLFEVRRNLINYSFKKHSAKNNKDLFDFNAVLESDIKEISKSWKSIIENDPDSINEYPVIPNEEVQGLKSEIKKQIEKYMRDNYPSLKGDL